MRTLSILTALFLFVQLGIAQPNSEFSPDCELPFAAIAVKREIDSNCGAEGVGTSKNTRANQLQNAQKNNFCVTGEPKDMKVNDFINLQKTTKDAGIKYGNYLTVPEDRSDIASLGEGTKVRFTGYIDKVKYANVYVGEGVNCKELGADNNDIHIELKETKNGKNKCKRISAEIVPHYRPNEWNVAKLDRAQELGLKVRLTGQLFFDASHTACSDPDSEGYRASSWEIHPVYRVEVLSYGKWIDIHEWNVNYYNPHEAEE